MSLLKVENLTKAFREIIAVNGVDFTVNKGEVFGLLGPNGAGKSTTISMIATLYKPTQGNIYYNDKSIFNDPKDFQQRLGVIPQEIALYPTLSGYENLKFWGNVYGIRGSLLKKRIDEISEIIGIDERLKDKVEKYSGGMKRRLNIGAALLHKPELLIMDEPTVGIDPQSRNHILDTVLELNKQGMTIIYTSHYMEEVEYLCSKICIMDQGHIIASGTKNELVEMISGSQKISIRFNDVNEELVSKLKEICYIEKIDIVDNELILMTENGKTVFKDIINKVGDTHSHILSIDVKKPNLEAVFLYLTGKALRD